MPMLQLLGITAFDNEDTTGWDDVYIIINDGQVQSNKHKMGRGSQASLTYMAPIPFDGSCKIALWEYDMDSPDDLLGETNATNDQHGNQTHTFKGGNWINTWKYELAYSVTP